MKNAFTLAEVLITLGIIGVVAALTMPSLIAKHQEKQTVVKMKKMYSVLSQAYNMYLADNEPIRPAFDEEGAQTVFNVFKPYLKIMKDCGITDGKGCIYTGQYTYKNGGIHTTPYSDSRYYKVLLSDGAAIWFRGNDSEKYDIDIFYDVNGASGPNKWGQDLFDFYIIGRELIPNGIPYKLGEEHLGFDSYCAPADGNGFGCAAWVIHRENMDYLHCDDLTWNGKSKCK